MKMLRQLKQQALLGLCFMRNSGLYNTAIGSSLHSQVEAFLCLCRESHAEAVGLVW